MSIATLLALSALAASVLLLFASAGRALPLVALVASGLEVASDLGLFHLTVPRIDLRLVLAIALGVVGVVAWFRATAKPAISAASVVALVGIIQLVVILRPIR